MARRKILPGAIVAGVTISIIVILVATNLSEMEMPAKQDEKEILKTKSTEVIGLAAVQIGNQLSLLMSTGDDTPQTLDEITLSDSAIGFGYGWLGESKTSGGDVKGEGSGQLRGYMVSAYLDNDSPNEWKTELITVDVIPGFGYCMFHNESLVELDITGNTIFIQTPSDSPPNINAAFVDRAASFELFYDDRCHSNQVAAKIIDVHKLE